MTTFETLSVLSPLSNQPATSGVTQLLLWSLLQSFNSSSHPESELFRHNVPPGVLLRGLKVAVASQIFWEWSNSCLKPHVIWRIPNPRQCELLVTGWFINVNVLINVRRLSRVPLSSTVMLSAWGYVAIRFLFLQFCWRHLDFKLHVIIKCCSPTNSISVAYHYNYIKYLMECNFVFTVLMDFSVSSQR